MWWECGECGFQVERSRRPVCCEECGVAGPVFVEAGVHGEGPAGYQSWRDVWLQAGIQGDARFTWVRS